MGLAAGGPPILLRPMGVQDTVTAIDDRCRIVTAWQLAKSLTFMCQATSGKCSSKVQQPHRTTSTLYDRQSPLACANDPYRPLCT
jgi:hypothetical protein